MAKKFVVRRIDGRLIRTVATREEVRAVALANPIASVKREDVKPIAVAVSGQEDRASLIKALELLLNLTPAECEREFIAELRRKLDQRYPGASK